MNVTMQAQGMPSDLNPHLDSSRTFELKLVQQPVEGRNVSPGQRSKGSKWPIDPPPILELVGLEKDPNKWMHLHNPNWFCSTSLIEVEVNDKNRAAGSGSTKDNMTGQLVSSLHKVKSNQDKTEHGYFAFGDLNIRDHGRYQLKFTLFEIRFCPDTQEMFASEVHSTISDVFKVHPGRNPENPRVSSELSKALSEAGVKIRIRKEATKRRAYHTDWSSHGPRDSMGRPNMLAPMVSNMAPPPQSARTGRNMGVDVADRLSTKNEPLTSPRDMKSQTSPTHFDQYSQNQMQTPMTVTRGGDMSYPNNVYSNTSVPMSSGANFQSNVPALYQLSHEQTNAWSPHDSIRTGMTTQALNDPAIMQPSHVGVSNRPPHKRSRGDGYSTAITSPTYSDQQGLSQLQNENVYASFTTPTSAPAQDYTSHISSYQPHLQSHVTQSYPQYPQSQPIMSQVSFGPMATGYQYPSYTAGTAAFYAEQ